jgi:hypothetical protein
MKNSSVRTLKIMPGNHNAIVSHKFGFRPKLPAQLLFHVDEKFALSPGIDSQPGGFDSSESIPGLHKRLQIWALVVMRRKHAEDETALLLI